MSLLILGDRGTGKTNLAARYALNQLVDTASQTQYLGAHRKVHIDEWNLHVRVTDFPCGPYRSHGNMEVGNWTSEFARPKTPTRLSRATMDGASGFGISSIPEATVATTFNPDFIFASFQEDYRKRLIQQSDAVVILFNPWKRDTFNWVRDYMVSEVAQSSQRKFLGKRVARLLDGLASPSAPQGESVSSANSSRIPKDPSNDSALTVIDDADQIPRLDKGTVNHSSLQSTPPISLPGSTTTLGTPRKSQNLVVGTGDSQTVSKNSTPTRHYAHMSFPGINWTTINEKLEVDPDYPVILIGARADRLQEYGGRERRAVSVEEATNLARRFGPNTTYMEVSSQSEENVEASLTTILTQVTQAKARQIQLVQERETKNRMHSQTTSVFSCRSTSRFKKLFKGVSTCFKSSKTPTFSPDTMRMSMGSVKEAQAVTIQQYSSSHPIQRRLSRGRTLPRKGRDSSQAHWNCSMLQSQAPTLSQIDPLPRLTLEDITIPDSHFGSNSVRASRSLHDSVLEPHNQVADQYSGISDITTATTSSRSGSTMSYKSNSYSSHWQQPLSKEPKEKNTLVRTGQVISHHVSISNSSVGEYSESTHGSITGAATLHSTPSQKTLDSIGEIRQASASNFPRSHISENMDLTITKPKQNTSSSSF